MTVDACFLFGKIIRPHGTKGEALVGLAVEQPENFTKKESVFVEINSKLIPFFIKKITLIQGKKAILQFEDINSEEELTTFLNANIHLPLSDLPKLRKGHFYYFEVIGYQIIDKNLGTLGTIHQIYEMPGQDLIEMSYKNKEVLIPISDTIVKEADHKSKTLNVVLPDGLLEIYLSEEEETEEADSYDDED